jgi:hypothetical protein
MRDLTTLKTKSLNLTKTNLSVAVLLQRDKLINLLESFRSARVQYH